MDDIDREVRRLSLKPLARRPRRASDLTTYLEALRRLDDRAIGEEILRQLRDVLSSLRSAARARDWKNPADAAKRVALAKALYASRKISKQQYVFFAASPVEAVHEGRHMDGFYDDELAPIREAIERIEEQHGLGPDEYWLRGQGPKEHTRLNKQYEAILETKFIETLREFDLHDLAALVEHSPTEFDQLRERGRRSVFHKDEYVLAIQDIVLQYETEAHQAASIGAYSAAVTSLGAGVEGLLLIRCLRSPHKAGRKAKTLAKRFRPRFPDDPSTWTFETLIEVCLAAGWLPPVETSIVRYDTAALAHALRLMRNYVHPGRRARERPWSEVDEREYRDAEAIYIVLISILGNVRRRRRGDKRQRTQTSRHEYESDKRA